MATTELTIRQLADEGGTTPIAPVTVTDAVLKGDGTTLTEELTALNKGLMSQLGAFYTGTVTTNSVASASETITMSLSLPKGIYVVTYDTAMNGLPANTQYQSSIFANGIVIAQQQNFSKSNESSLLRHAVTALVEFKTSDNNTVQGRLYQRSGSTLSLITNNLHAVRIGIR